MKECRVCGDAKPVTEYHKNSRAIDGLFSDCKKCRKNKAAKYYKENKQKILQQNKQWSNKNKGRHKFLQARWEQDNKEVRRIKSNKNAKERYKKNPHKICEYVSRRHAKKIKATRPKKSALYNPDQAYIPRIERKEWEAVGVIGICRLKKGQPVADNWIKIGDINKTTEEWFVR